MSSTTVLDRPAGSKIDYLSDDLWEEHEQTRAGIHDDVVGPELDQVTFVPDPLKGAPIEAIAVPACPRKKQHLSEHLTDTDRAGGRRARKDARNSTHQAGPERTPLNPLERIQLHKGTIDLNRVKGRKLNRCERDIVRKLKKQRRKTSKKK